MNIWQICQVLQGVLRAKTWPGGTNPVFDSDSVRVIPQGDEIQDLDEGLIPPLCLIMPLTGDIDPEYKEESNFVMRNIDITLVTVNQGDRIGETPIMGGMRVDSTQSAGRGLAEIEEPLFQAIKELAVEDGIVIQFQSYGEGQVRRDPANNYIGIQDYTFRVYCSTDQSYQAADQLAAVGGTGEVALSWVNPPVIDTVYRGVLVRKPGLVAPASISDGTIVLSSLGLVDSSFADTPLAAGTYSYSFFVTYDTTNNPPSTDQVVSSPVSATATVS